MSFKKPFVVPFCCTAAQTLNAELARLKRSEQLSKLTEADKRLRDRERWTAWLASYGARLQRLAAEAEAEGGGFDAAARAAVMNGTNPRFILRNWMAQQAIERAEKGDYSEVARWVVGWRGACKGC